MTEAPINTAIERSAALYAALVAHVGSATFDQSQRTQLTVTMCGIGLEHGVSLRILIARQNNMSAIALLRLQYEALTRAIWLLHAANEYWLSKLDATLELDSHKNANDLPSLTEMLKAIEGKLTAPVHQMLAQVKDISWKALFRHFLMVLRNRLVWRLILLIDNCSRKNSRRTLAYMAMVITVAFPAEQTAA